MEVIIESLKMEDICRESVCTDMGLTVGVSYELNF